MHSTAAQHNPQSVLNGRLCRSGNLSLAIALCLTSLAAAAPPANLERDLNRLLDGYRGRGRVALVVEDASTGTRWYARHPDRPQRPASLMKLFVTAAALEHLGPDFAFETRAHLAGDEVLIYGGGDPALGDERLARRDGRAQDAFFDEIARGLRERGVSSVSKIVLDDSIFDKEWRHPDWPADQSLAWYQAPVGGLNFNDNCLDARALLRAGRIEVQPFPALPDDFVENALQRGRKHNPRVTRAVDGDIFRFDGSLTRDETLGPIAARRPDVFFGHALRHALASRGIEVRGEVVRRALGQDVLRTPPLATHRTPLNDVLWRCNSFSQNLFAECLLKALPAYEPGGARTAVPGSWPAGTEALRAKLAALQMPLDAAEFRDGSGLSHRNRVTAAQVCRLLQIMAQRPTSRLFIDSLATPGEDGTLRRRLAPGLRGKIRAKTGTLKDVHGLGGYVSRADGVTLTFALLVDGGAEGDLGRQLCTTLLKTP